jgi:four helix bundle protein
MTTFDHEKLDVYRLARDGVREVRVILARVPRGHGDMADQLRRASLSVCLNIAEGAGAWAPKEKARFYRMARASATECAAVLDHMVDVGLATAKQTSEAKTVYARVVGGLVKLCQSVEARTP